MQKFYRFSAAILIVSLVLLTAPPAQAVHVIAAGVAPGVPSDLFALTNTGEVYHSANFTTWTLIGTVPGAFEFSVFDFEGVGLWLLSVQGNTLFHSLVSAAGIGTAKLTLGLCSGTPIRSFVIISDPFISITIVHEDGTICLNGMPTPGPAEPVAVEETTWGAVKDKYEK